MQSIGIKTSTGSGRRGGRGHCGGRGPCDGRGPCGGRGRGPRRPPSESLSEIDEFIISPLAEEMNNLLLSGVEQ